MTLLTPKGHGQVPGRALKGKQPTMTWDSVNHRGKNKSGGPYKTHGDQQWEKREQSNREI
jgi:hypothetical protein